MTHFRSLCLLAARLAASGSACACASSGACPPALARTSAAPALGQTAAASKTDVIPTADDMAAAAATLESFHAAAAAADEEAYFALFSEGGVFLGTDAKERWTVPAFRAYAHPRFASGKAWSFRAIRRDLSVRADVAWFDEDLETPNLGPARGSGVLVRDARGDWKIAQYNLSVPIPNERFEDVRKIIGGGHDAPAR